jgi:hypothetical protein
VTPEAQRSFLCMAVLMWGASVERPCINVNY